MIFYKTCEVFSKFSIWRFLMMFISEILGIFTFVTDVFFTVVIQLNRIASVASNQGGVVL